MQIKYNYIFIPLLILIAGAVWFLNQNDDRKASTLVLADRALLNIEEVDVIKIIGDENTIRLQRINSGGEGAGTPDDWRVTEPWHSGCDPETLAELIDTIQHAKADRELTNVLKTQLAEYGVTEPSSRLHLASSSGEVLMDLALGHLNPAGTAKYAILTDSPESVFLIPIYTCVKFEIDLDDIRDKRALYVNQDAITYVQLSGIETDIVIENQDDDWMMTSPHQFPTSPARMDILLHDIVDLRAVEFLPADAVDPELSEKVFDVITQTADGSTLRLTLHGEDYSRGIFATSSSQPTPFIVEAYIYDRLALDPKVFYHTSVVDVPVSAITKVYVRRPDMDNIELRRDGRAEYDFIIAGRDGEGPSRVEFQEFFKALFGLQPLDSVDPPHHTGDYGIDPVFFLMIEVLTSDEEPSIELVIGGQDDDGNFYATQESGNYFTIDGRLMVSFIKAANKLNELPG